MQAINCINPCPKGEKPRKNVDTYTGFDYFFAKQRGTMAVGGIKLEKNMAKLIWDNSLPKDAKNAYLKMAATKKKQLIDAWKKWEQKMERQKNPKPVVKRILNEMLKSIVNDSKKSKKELAIKISVSGNIYLPYAPPNEKSGTKRKSGPRRKPGPKPFKGKRKKCPNCSKTYQAAYLKKHLATCIKISGLTNNNANTANAMETDDSNSSANSGGNINSNDKTDGDNKAPIKKSKLS